MVDFIVHQVGQGICVGQARRDTSGSNNCCHNSSSSGNNNNSSSRLAGVVRHLFVKGLTRKGNFLCNLLLGASIAWVIHKQKHTVRTFYVHDPEATKAQPTAQQPTN